MLAAGVCHSDLHTRDGDWPLDRPDRARARGRRGGRVAWARACRGLAPGDRVVLSWNAPCGHCLRCVTGRPWLCVDNGAQQQRDDRRHDPPASRIGRGRLALLRHRRLLRADDRPRDRCDPRAARDAGRRRRADRLRGRHRCRRGASTRRASRPGPRSSSSAAAASASRSIMGAALSGATPIIAIDSNPAKLELARDLGATHGVLGRRCRAGRRGDLPGRGPDYVFEVGRSAGDAAARAEPRAARRHARCWSAWLRRARRSRSSSSPFVDGGRTLKGSNYGSTVPQRDFPRLARLHVEGRLPIDRLIEAEIPLDELEDALDRAAPARGRATRRRVLTPPLFSD